MKKSIFRTSVNTELEKQLIPRLNLMGYILILFSGCALFYAILVSPYLASSEEEAIPMPQTMELAGFTTEATTLIEKEKISLYMIAAIFAVVGGSCIVTAWKKKPLS
jgi:drug/metabolite transporter (DMT)-like permease